jgi:hypothetical protein
MRLWCTVFTSISGCFPSFLVTHSPKQHRTLETASLLGALGGLPSMQLPGCFRHGPQTNGPSPTESEVSHEKRRSLVAVYHFAF